MPPKEFPWIVERSTRRVPPPNGATLPTCTPYTRFPLTVLPRMRPPCISMPYKPLSRTELSVILSFLVWMPVPVLSWMSLRTTSSCEPSE